MSKLYEILKQLEAGKGLSPGPQAGPQEKFLSIKTSAFGKKVVLVAGILVLLGIAALGGLYLSKVLFSSSSPFFSEKREKTAAPVKQNLPPSQTPPSQTPSSPQTPLSEASQTPPSEAFATTSVPSTAKPDSKKTEPNSESEIILSKANTPFKATAFKKSEKSKSEASDLEKTKALSPKPQVSSPIEKKALSQKPPDLSEEPLLTSVRKESVAKVPRFGPEERLRSLLVRAEALRQEGKCEKALPLYREYLKNRREPEVLNNYAACLFLLGSLEEAEKIFKESLDLKDDPEVRLNLLMLALKKGRYTEACRQFEFLKNRSQLRLYKGLIQILEERCL